MKKPETVFKERIWPLLKNLPNCWAEKINQVSKRGTPDFLMCIRGRFVALELKRSEKEKPDPLQRHTLSKIEQSGGFSFVVCPQNWEEVYLELKNMPDIF